MAAFLDPGVQLAKETVIRVAEDLEAEAGDVADEVRSVADDVRQIARNPLSAFSSDLMSPLLSALLKALRKG